VKPDTQAAIAAIGRALGAVPAACPPRRRGGNPKKYHWTPERDEIIRSRYDSQTATITLAQRLATLKRVSLQEVFGQLGLPWEGGAP